MEVVAAEYGTELSPYAGVFLVIFLSGQVGGNHLCVGMAWCSI